jgi:CheY-like chemotaxis protein
MSDQQRAPASLVRLGRRALEARECHLLLIDDGHIYRTGHEGARAGALRPVDASSPAHLRLFAELIRRGEREIVSEVISTDARFRDMEIAGMLSGGFAGVVVEADGTGRKAAALATFDAGEAVGRSALPLLRDLATTLLGVATPSVAVPQPGAPGIAPTPVRSTADSLPDTIDVRLDATPASLRTHEVRTLLTSIIGFAELFSDSATGEQREFAEIISRDSQRLLDTLFDTHGSSPASSPEQGTRAKESPVMASSKARVLVVEDNPDTRLLVSMVLRNSADIHIAAHASAAMSLLQDDAFDIVLMDINLGVGASGIDVLNHLREIPHQRGARVIALTGYAQHGDRERFLKAGFDDYLRKPFAAAELRKAIVIERKASYASN